jgi:SWI/SNF-related matrix-associated actin-dependent regulator 1 of chromatin subfamily A
MSGTAVLNRPHELSPQLDALHYLDTIFEGREAYETEYCGRTLTQINTKGGGKRKVFVYNKPKGSKMVELHQRLLPFFIRRKKEDVLTELPPLSFARVVVDLANRKEYEALELEIAMLPPMQRLGKLAQLRQLCGIGKIPSMIEWIEEFLENEEKLVVFATHRSVQRALLEHFVKWKPAAILGQAEGGSIKRNQEQMDRFQTDPDCLLAICSTGAAREGITLHAASNLLMTELEWVPGVMDQAFNRIHRYGQTAERVTIWTLAADQSFDNTLLEKLGAKRLVTGEILDGEAEVLDEQEIKGAVIRDLVARVARRRKAA